MKGEPSVEDCVRCWPFGVVGILVGAAVTGFAVGTGATLTHRMLESLRKEESDIERIDGSDQEWEDRYV